MAGSCPPPPQLLCMQESGSPRLLALMVQAEALQAAELGLQQAARRQCAALKHQSEPPAEVKGGLLASLAHVHEAWCLQKNPSFHCLIEHSLACAALARLGSGGSDPELSACIGISHHVKLTSRGAAGASCIGGGGGRLARKGPAAAAGDCCTEAEVWQSSGGRPQISGKCLKCVNTCRSRSLKFMTRAPASLFSTTLFGGPHSAHAVSVKLQATSHSWPATSGSRALLLGRATLLCSTY